MRAAPWIRMLSVLVPLALFGCEDAAEAPTAAPPPLPTTTPENTSLPPPAPQLQLRATFDSFYPMQLDYALFYSAAQPPVTPLLTPTSTLHEAVELYGKMLTGNFFVRYCEDAACTKVTALEKATLVTPLPAGVENNAGASYSIKPTAKLYDTPFPLYPEFTLSVSNLPKVSFYADLFFDTGVGTPCKVEEPATCSTTFDVRPTALAVGGHYEGEPPTLSVFNPKAHRPFLVQPRAEGITTVAPLFRFSHIVGLLECSDTASCLSKHPQVAQATPTPQTPTTTGPEAGPTSPAPPLTADAAPTTPATEPAQAATTTDTPSGEPATPPGANNADDSDNNGGKKPGPGIHPLPEIDLPPLKLPRIDKGDTPKVPKRLPPKVGGKTPTPDDSDGEDGAKSPRTPPSGGNKKPPVTLDPTQVGRIVSVVNVAPPSVLKVLLELDLPRTGGGATGTGSSSSSGGTTRHPPKSGASSSSSTSSSGGESAEPMVLINGAVISLLAGGVILEPDALKLAMEAMAAMEKEKAEAQAKAKDALKKVQKTVEDFKNDTTVKEKLDKAKKQADDAINNWGKSLQNEINKCKTTQWCNVSSIQTYIKGMQSHANVAQEIMNEALDKFNALQSGLNSAIAEAEAAVQTAQETLQSTVNQVNEEVNQVMSEINGMVQQIQSEVMALKSQLEATIQDTIAQIETIQSTVTSAIEEAKKKVADAITDAENKVKDAWDQAKGAANEVKDTFNEIVDSFGGLGDLF